MGGSFLYWFVVSQRISHVRHRLDQVRLGKINSIAGLVLIALRRRADRRDGDQAPALLVSGARFALLARESVNSPFSIARHQPVDERDDRILAE